MTAEEEKIMAMLGENWRSAFGVEGPQIEKRLTFNAAKKFGFTDIQAQFLAKAEGFNLLMLSSAAQSFDEHVAKSTAMLAKQNVEQQELMGELVYAIGKNAMRNRRPSLATWATAAYAQRTLFPVVQPLPGTTPKADIHDTPQVIANFELAPSYVQGGFTAAFDPSMPHTDRDGVIILTKAGGVVTAADLGQVIGVLTYLAPFANRPFVTGYIESETQAPEPGIYGPIVPGLGGLATSVTLVLAQFPEPANYNAGDTITLRYHVVGN